MRVGDDIAMGTLFKEAGTPLSSILVIMVKVSPFFQKGVPKRFRR
jgi:hypothetical protein